MSLLTLGPCITNFLERHANLHHHHSHIFTSIDDHSPPKYISPKLFPSSVPSPFALAQDTTEPITTTDTPTPIRTPLPSSVADSTIAIITSTWVPPDFSDAPWGDACIDEVKSILNAQPTPPYGQPLRDYFESSFSVWVTANLATSSPAAGHTPINSADIVTLCSQWQTSRWVGQTVPASVTADHETYKLNWSSWARHAGSALESAVEECKTVVYNGAMGQAVLAVATNQRQCSEGFSLMHSLKTAPSGAEVTSLGLGAVQPGGGDGGDDGVTSTTASTAGAARENGYVVAVVVAAAGVAAAL
ncbi:uncharacterized protein PODANS_2_8405 [Podospora anserina S mat+]|uniref:Podospora anserina S mat+ genomic DNA chromosome 2, supercontig 2 n=1 Tax=Podospora anserina (strain S / ATCC MYA-4624 / DSM 980 / FGSC 10383) TaxID=515849 RepID=B2B6P5_PODAN|nr:uncharacterized protein PODANS_2_8405 [Podospora anserina S mat+]CAP73472.1 unnamed protein product [Podospora anserina S mat+]CDP25873.1 Putative protein of unknown function [Podospora anserina S mat+]